MGLPVIATRWSGHLEFMDDETAFLLGCDVGSGRRTGHSGSAYFRGHRWAERIRETPAASSCGNWWPDPEEGERRGQAARTHILSHFTRYHVAQRVANRLHEIVESQPSQTSSRPETSGRRATAETCDDRLAVVWEGSQFVHHSLALVNRNSVFDCRERPPSVDNPL